MRGALPMAKKNQPQENNGQKIQTKYDRKMEERRKKEEQDKKEARIFKIGAMAFCLIIVAAIVGSIAASAIRKNSVLNDTYVTIGDHAVTKVEYDFYFNGIVNNYINTYSQYLSFMGLDTTKDLDEQPYDDNATWKDYFDRSTVEQIKQMKALADDAAANGFEYDTTQDYENMLNSINTGAETEGVTVAEYYKTIYGTYATEKNMEPFIKEGLTGAAYYNSLLEKNTPTQQEIKDHYAANQQDYDKVDYRSFALKAEIAEEATEEDIAVAMTEAKNKADAMMAARQEGEDFKALCLANATEEEKATYEDEETDASFKEGAYYIGIPAAISDWLYESGRAESDITVIEDAANNQYYVVEFINRYYDEADDEEISATMAADRSQEYLNALIDNYEVVDNKGDLKYLLIPTEDVETAVEENAEDTEAVAEENVEDTEAAEATE